MSFDDKAISYQDAGLTDYEIDQIFSNQKISLLLDGVVALGCNTKDAASWVLTDYLGILRKDGKTIDEHNISAETLATIIKMVSSGEINRGAGKKILIAVVESNVDPVAYCEQQGFNKKFDASTIEKVIDDVIKENEKAVLDYKNGKEKAFQALFGACMRVLKGVGDPSVIKELLQNRLS